MRGPVIIKRWRDSHHVHKAAHAAGLRFRTDVADLPGKPHLLFPKHKTALFICGCWDYGHAMDGHFVCDATISGWYAAAPAERMKLDAVLFVLRNRGWNASVLWDCEIGVYDRDAPGCFRTNPGLVERVRELVISPESSSAVGG